MAKVKSNELGEAINTILTDYGHAVEESTAEIVEQVAKETVDELKSNSPKKTGRYAKGWRKRKLRSNGTATTYEVYNATDYQLTHLLEFGHEKWIRGKDTGSRVAARPHIRPAMQKAEKELVKRLKITITKG